MEEEWILNYIEQLQIPPYQDHAKWVLRSHNTLELADRERDYKFYLDPTNVILYNNIRRIKINNLKKIPPSERFHSVEKKHPLTVDQIREKMKFKLVYLWYLKNVGPIDKSVFWEQVLANNYSRTPAQGLPFNSAMFLQNFRIEHKEKLRRKIEKYRLKEAWVRKNRKLTIPFQNINQATIDHVNAQLQLGKRRFFHVSLIDAQTVEINYKVD